jgi:hypothetical protein
MRSKVHFAKAVDIVDIFLKIFYFLYLLWLVTTEKSIARSCLKQNQHSNYYIKLIDFDKLIDNNAKSCNSELTGIKILLAIIFCLPLYFIVGRVVFLKLCQK